MCGLLVQNTLKHVCIVSKSRSEKKESETSEVTRCPLTLSIFFYSKKNVCMSDKVYVRCTVVSLKQSEDAVKMNRPMNSPGNYFSFKIE